MIRTWVEAAADSLQLASRRSLAVRQPTTALRTALPWMLGLRGYGALYARVAGDGESTFCARVLSALEIIVELANGSAPGVPSAGPLIVVANHPHGMLDGLALITLVEKSRPDVRVLANELLGVIPELAQTCLFVDASEQRAARQTRTGLRGALRWLQDGHALIMFPAGTVAHRGWQRSSTPLDDPWRDTVARLAAKSGAAVVPAYIAGRNSCWFYRLGQLHPALRTMLLPRELLVKRGQRLVVRLGRPATLPAGDRIQSSRAIVTARLRADVERLAFRPAADTQPALALSTTSASALRADIGGLTLEHRLLRSGRFDVYCAPASRIPAVLHEIGRLRETTFRSVGEGTGRAIDLDEFDEHYLHLFVWDRDRAAVAGAYRLGLVDRIVAAEGVGGLYTSTLYRYDERLLSRLGPAIELGRSFVRAEYQRSSNALLLLWKGIAQFVARSGEYRVLFGPVSISARYTDLSRQLLQAFLMQNSRHRELAALVEPRTPTDSAWQHVETATDLQELNRLVAGLEADHKGIPVLLRQYLRLNAKLLAFNIDPAFGDALDALMMVDLAMVDRAILTRYFGSDTASLFLQRMLSPSAAA